MALATSDGTQARHHRRVKPNAHARATQPSEPQMLKAI